jgi:hypothetical protein
MNGSFLTDSPTVAATPYFCVGTTKLIVMNVATFGLYPIWWFSKNWQTEQDFSGEMFSPNLRALFCPVFFYSFARRTKDRAILFEVPSRYSTVLLSAAFLLLTLAGRLPDPVWMLGLTAGFMLIPIQNTLQRLNAVRGIGPGPEARFSKINIAWVVVAGFLLVLGIIGTFLPDPELANTSPLALRVR